MYIYIRRLMIEPNVDEERDARAAGRLNFGKDRY